jgi:tRNA pseudouridine38-40 synthase
MRNLFLRLRFDGSPFHGWQIQPNGVTVQETLQDAIGCVLGRREAVTGCSRTDAGVHAMDYACNFRTEHDLPAEKLPAALNFYLPQSISVLSCREAPPEFHARYDCQSKEYCYRIRNAALRDPFLLHRAWLEPFPLDEAFLRIQAQDFLGRHDFSSFCAAGSSAKTTVRTVTRAEVLRSGEELRFFFAADGFLYRMVRIMTGTLLELAKGRLEPGSIPAILAKRDRGAAGCTAPAQGLYLWRADYAPFQEKGEAGNG